MSLPPSPTPPHKTFLQSIVMKGESVWWRRTGLAVASLTVALGPTVFLIVAFNYEAFSHSTALILVSVSTFCTLTAYFISQTMFRSTRLATLTQTDDAEVCRDGSAPEDAPPVYDAVVSKPPSYEFVCGNPPDLSCWEDDAEAGVPMRDACTDCDLPTYAQVTQAPSPV